MGKCSLHTVTTCRCFSLGLESADVMKATPPNDLKDTDKMRAYVLAFVQKSLDHFWWGKYIDPGFILTFLLSAMRQDAHKGTLPLMEVLTQASPDDILQVFSIEQLEAAKSYAQRTNVVNAGVALPGGGGCSIRECKIIQNEPLESTKRLHTLADSHQNKGTKRIGVANFEGLFSLISAVS